MVITGLTRNQLAGATRPAGSNPAVSAIKKELLHELFFIVLQLHFYSVSFCLCFRLAPLQICLFSAPAWRPTNLSILCTRLAPLQICLFSAPAWCPTNLSILCTHLVPLQISFLQIASHCIRPNRKRFKPIFFKLALIKAAVHRSRCFA